VKRADFGMTRELLDEIGALSESPDVWIEIDAELLAQTQATPAIRSTGVFPVDVGSQVGSS